jgi:hypothetical protein
VQAHPHTQELVSGGAADYIHHIYAEHKPIVQKENQSDQSHRLETKTGIKWVKKEIISVEVM